jgi:hypothetical protein
VALNVDSKPAMPSKQKALASGSENSASTKTKSAGKARLEGKQSKESTLEA